jgi:glucan phosphoethanolaminetransferase (alkaline phosphatase superfamily)
MSKGTLPSDSRHRADIALFTGVVLAVLLPDVAWIMVADGKFFEHSLPYALMAGLIPSLVAVLGVFALFGRRLFVGLLLLVPFLPLVPIETVYVVRYGEPSWYAIIATIIESNSHEAVDFLGSMLWPLLGASVACLLFGMAAVVRGWRSDYQWQGRSRNWVLTACVAIVVIAIGHSLLHVASASQDKQRTRYSLPDWTADIEPSFPVGIPVRYLHYRAEWDAMREQVDRLSSFRFNSRTTRDVAARQIYVLLIGETGRKDRWQLYGYERPTNPELSQTGDLITLADIITPASESRDSVPMIISRKRAMDMHDYFRERSIIRVFAEAGFETYWLSNQMAVGNYDSPIAVAAYDAAHVSFYSVADWGKSGTYDEVLLGPLKDAINGGKSKLFIVLHSMGSHANYAHRYPLEFDVFKPSLKTLRDPDYYDIGLTEEVRNSYDNSIVYTDHFISDVVKVLASTGSISTLWYVSDHGEDFLTKTCKLAGHGNGTRADFPVPSVFWYSKTYAMEFSEALAEFRRHSTERITTENVFESLTDMAALDFDGHDSTWSLFSRSWAPHQRLIRGLTALDFDTASVSPNCQVMMPPRLN